MEDEIGRITKSVEDIGRGIGDLREKNAGRDVRDEHNTKRIDVLCESKIPHIEERLSKVEAFQIKLGVGLAIVPFVIPLILNYVFKLIAGD